MEKGLVLEKAGKTQKALDTYRYALTRVKNDTVAFNMLSGRIDQIALLWMIEAEKLLKEQKYIRAYNLVKHVAEFSDLGKREIRRFKSWVVLGEGKNYQKFGFIGKAMGKYAEALSMNSDLIYEVKALQHKAGIQMAKIAKEADEFEEIQLAIHSLEFARELAGGIGERNERLLTDLKEKLKSYDDYKSRLLIDRRMDIGRLEQTRARSDRLKIGQTLPQVEDLLGEPHETIIGIDGINSGEQLWIYFIKNKSLHLSFQNFQLFKIEEI
jgi:tetratricopeptide (TPR) repeat protein